MLLKRKTHRKPVEVNRWIYDLIFCADCGAHVPVFRDLAPPEQELLDEWIANPPFYPVVAKATGLSLVEAKTWRMHLDDPPKLKGKLNSVTCPRCRRWLDTPFKRRCLHCGARWLKTGEIIT